MDKMKVIISGLAGHMKDKVMHRSKHLSIEPSIPVDNSKKSSRTFHNRIIQNFRLVWLDSSADEISIGNSLYTIRNLRKTIYDLTTFTAVGKCMEFMSNVENEKIFLVCSEEFSEIIVPMVHNMTQIYCIYIFCTRKAGEEAWIKEWPKVKGIYKDITSMHEALKLVCLECDQNMISMSFVPPTTENPNEKLDLIDQSFMHTQLLKEILLTTDFEPHSLNEFITVCREQFGGNTPELQNVEKIKTDYQGQQPIWWYTYKCFLYSMLNRALRTLEVDLIIQMDFFIRDLHNNIAALHTEQYQGHNGSDSFILYRGQGLSQKTFENLKNTHGGLMSFNNFLFASQNRDVSFDFAQRIITTLDLVGVLFVMKIHPSIASCPFANIGNVSYSQREKEILFSMHSVFRIEHIKQIDENDRLWQVDLTLTNKTDPELQMLTEHLREETYPNLKGWDRLGMLLIKLGHLKKAEDLYEILLDQSTDDSQKAHLYHMLGLVKTNQENHVDAIEFYSRSIRMNGEILPSTHPDLSASQTGLGLAYNNIGQYAYALTCHEKALKIREKTLPPDHPDLAATYNNIANVYYNMNKLSDALSYFEKSFEIQKSIFPPNSPNLATAYNNIAEIYRDMGKYSKALSCHQTALEIYQNTLPVDHPDLAISYNNIGWVYTDMGDYSQALTYFERALTIFQHSLPPDHPNIKNVEESIEIIKTRNSK